MWIKNFFIKLDFEKNNILKSTILKKNSFLKSTIFENNLHTQNHILIQFTP